MTTSQKVAERDPKAAFEHFVYEITMLARSAAIVERLHRERAEVRAARPNRTLETDLDELGVLSNLALEGWLVHARTVLELLRSRTKDPHENDITLAHLGVTATPQGDSTLLARIDQHLSHLTWSRTERKAGWTPRRTTIDLLNRLSEAARAIQPTPESRAVRQAIDFALLQVDSGPWSLRRHRTMPVMDDVLAAWPRPAAA